MRVVVTGGSGVLGAPVVDALRERGVDVIAASRRTGVDLASGKGLSDAEARLDLDYQTADDLAAAADLILGRARPDAPTR